MSVPALRLTPAADSSTGSTAFAITNSANNTNNFVVTKAGAVAIGASGTSIADSRELVQSAHSCGTTTTCANASNGADRMIFGSVALSSGTPSTATVSGISPAFSSTASFFCTATNATTQANPVKVENASSSRFTITGPNMVTDTINYQCIGN